MITGWKGECQGRISKIGACEAYIVGVERCVILPVGVVLDIVCLSAVLEESLASSLVYGFELVTAENDGLDRPVRGDNIVDL